MWQKIFFSGHTNKILSSGLKHTVLGFRRPAESVFIFLYVLSYEGIGNTFCNYSPATKMFPKRSANMPLGFFRMSLFLNFQFNIHVPSCMKHNTLFSFQFEKQMFPLDVVTYDRKIAVVARF